jgi:hypothetical protein
MPACIKAGGEQWLANHTNNWGIHNEHEHYGGRRSRRPACVPVQGTHHRQARFQPLAGATGRSGHPPVHRHGLRLLGVLVAAVQGAGRYRSGGLRTGHELHRTGIFVELRLADLDARLDLHAVLHLPRLLGSDLGWLAGTRRATQGRRCIGAVLVRRSADLGAGYLYPPDLVDVARFGRDRRYRSGSGLYLASVDPDQVVPGQAWHGDRYGNHGFRWRRDGRCTIGDCADEPLSLG